MNINIEKVRKEIVESEELIPLYEVLNIMLKSSSSTSSSIAKVVFVLLNGFILRQERLINLFYALGVMFPRSRENVLKSFESLLSAQQRQARKAKLS